MYGVSTKSSYKQWDRRNLGEEEKKERRSSCGRVIRAPQRLEQDRIEGKPKYTQRQRERKLKETLAKSIKLTENLLKRMDKDSDDEEDIDDENIGRMARGGERPGKRIKMEANTQPKVKLEVERYGREFNGVPISPEQPLLVTGGVMKDYQLAGLNWVVNLRKVGANGILGDEMGLGKTLQTISLFCHLYEVEKDTGPFLVIAPLSTIANWQKEVRRFAPAVPCELLYPRREALDMWGQLEDKVPCPELGGREIGSVFITSYDTAIGLRNMLEDVKWSYVVVDEGHRIKNRDCRLVKYLKKMDSTNRLLLTGTPLQNNMAELWALLNFLQPDIFDDYEIFESWFNAKSLHEDKDEKDRLIQQEEKNGILASIHKIVGPFMLRRVKTEVELSLPPKTEVVVYCPFTQAQADQYKAFQGLLARTKKKVAKEEPMLGGNLGSYQMQYMVDLRSAVNHPYILQNPGTIDREIVNCCGKMQVLDQMLRRLMKDGHKTLIFSQMTRLLDVLVNYLEMSKIPFCMLDGRMSYMDRQEHVERFQNDPDVMVFLLSTRAGGLGINLTAADTCIIYDSDWNPQQDLQAQDRCHRIGQTKPVMVYRLVTKNTIDQVMVERAQAKRALERLIVHKDKFKSGAENLKKTGTSLATKEIMRLLVTEEVATTSIARPGQWGLGQEELDQLLDRTNNVDDLREKIGGGCKMEDDLQMLDYINPDKKFKCGKCRKAFKTGKERKNHECTA